MDEKKSGGRRPGAGRKPTADPINRNKSFYLKTSQSTMTQQEVRAALDRVELLEDAAQRVATEWERQKGLFQELKKDGWMDLAIRQMTGYIPANEPDGPDPCDEAREYNDAMEWAEQPTPYDP
jgi:uncharacterized protein (UPF0335 family)